MSEVSSPARSTLDISSELAAILPTPPLPGAASVDIGPAVARYGEKVVADLGQLFGVIKILEHHLTGIKISSIGERYGNRAVGADVITFHGGGCCRCWRWKSGCHRWLWSRRWVAPCNRMPVLVTRGSRWNLR